MVITRRIAAMLAVVTLSIGCFAQPQAIKGIIDARAHNFEEQALKLNGDWQFHSNELIDPSEEKSLNQYWFFTDPWREAQGVATYKLVVLVDSSIQSLAVDVPQLYSAYTLWVNGNVVAKNGKIGTTYNTTQPQWLPQVKSFDGKTDTLTFTLQMANFHHAIGGAKNPIHLGLPDSLLDQQRTSHLLNTILLGVLSFIGLLFLGTYLFAKREKSVLYFSLLCLTWALRSIFSEQYLAIHWMPWFDWELALKIEYITLYLTVVWAMLFVSYLYPLDTNKWIKGVLLYPNFLFVFLTMATPAVLYTKLLGVYLFLQGALLIYILVVVLRAAVYERYGAWFSAAGLVSLVAAFSYNYISYQGMVEFSPLAIFGCYLVFFFLMAVALGYQLSPKANERNFSDSLSFDEIVGRK